MTPPPGRGPAADRDAESTHGPTQETDFAASLRLPGLSEQVHQALAARLAPAAVTEHHDGLAELVLGRWLCVLFGALGLPADDWVQVARWADDGGPEALGSYVDMIVGARCATPTDDLLSDLISAEVDGDGFTADELRAIVVALVTA